MVPRAALASVYLLEKCDLGLKAGVKMQPSSNYCDRVSYL